MSVRSDSSLPLLIDEQPNLRIVLCTPEVWYASRAHTLLESHDQGQTWCLRGILDLKLHIKLAHQFRLSTRLARGGIHYLIPLADGGLLAIVRKAIAYLGKGERVFRNVFQIPEGSRPRNICKGPGEKLYFGEYFQNSQRREVFVYGSDDGGQRWDKVFRFPAGSIKHIHQIKYDPYRKYYWIVTGDFDHEPKIAYSDDEFKSIHIIAEGSQLYRVAALCCTPEGLFYGTDTQMEQNYLVHYDVSHNSFEKVFELEGSSLHMSQAGPWIFASTAIEPSKVNHSSFATLWAFKTSGERKLLAHWERDGWDLKYFLFATFKCPEVESPESLTRYATYVNGLKGHDQSSQIWQL